MLGRLGRGEAMSTRMPLASLLAYQPPAAPGAKARRRGDVVAARPAPPGGVFRRGNRWGTWRRQQPPREPCHAEESGGTASEVGERGGDRCGDGREGQRPAARHDERARREEGRDQHAENQQEKTADHRAGEATPRPTGASSEKNPALGPTPVPPSHTGCSPGNGLGAGARPWSPCGHREARSNGPEVGPTRTHRETGAGPRAEQIGVAA